MVVEFKYSLEGDLNDLTKEAINQIKDLDNYKPFLDYNVVLLGVAFGNREVMLELEPLEK